MACTTVTVPGGENGGNGGEEPQPSGCIQVDGCSLTIQDDGSIIYSVEGRLTNVDGLPSAQATVEWFLDGTPVASYSPWRFSGTQPSFADSNDPPGSVSVGTVSQARQQFGSGPVNFEVRVSSSDFPVCGNSRQSCGTVTIPAAFDPAGVTIDGCSTPDSLTAGQTGEVQVEIRNTNEDTAQVSLTISGNGTAWGTADVEVPTGATVFNVPVTPPESAAGQSITPSITINSVERATNTTSNLLRGSIL